MAHSERHNSLYFDYRYYPFERPAQMDGKEDIYPVVIIGGGPVGMAVALELALYDVPSIILSNTDSEAAGSRAACIARRSIEILHRFGMGDAFDSVALPWTSGTSFYREAPIFRLEMPHSDQERHYPMANLQQNILERQMIDCIGKNDLIDLRWQNEVIDFSEDETCVTFVVKTPEGEYRLKSRFAVAADGARSNMRKLLNLELSGETHAAQYLIADIRLKSASPTERRAWFDSPINKGSTILMHKQPYDIWRVDYQLRPEDDVDAELRTERVKQRIQAVLDMAGETGPWELDWISLYRAYSLCLDDYVKGRVCFVGDAAHLVPIFGVKGLNSGFGDANNLGWKLAAVLNGHTGADILKTYSQERRAATLDIFEEAGKSTRFMTPPTRGYQLMRKGILSLALTQGWAGNLANPRQSVPFRYADSVLNSFIGQDDEFDIGPGIGESARSVKLGNRFLHDYLDHRPSLIYFADPERPEAVPSALQHIAQKYTYLNVLVFGPETIGKTSAGMTYVTDTKGVLAKAYGAKSGAYYVLRPDWHVVARTLNDPGLGGLEKAINRMFGYEL